MVAREAIHETDPSMVRRPAELICLRMSWAGTRSRSCFAIYTELVGRLSRGEIAKFGVGALLRWVHQSVPQGRSPRCIMGGRGYVRRVLVHGDLGSDNSTNELIGASSIAVCSPSGETLKGWRSSRRMRKLPEDHEPHRPAPESAEANGVPQLQPERTSEVK